MVVAGLDSGNVDTVELVSLDPLNHPVPDCLKDLAPYPIRVRGASGAELQGEEHLATISLGTRQSI